MITYRVDASAPHTHRFEVELLIAKPWPDQRLSLPVWIPGSYLVREFGRHISGLAATQGGRELGLRQLDKTTWEVQGLGKGALTVRYSVYAFDTSVRTAFLNTERGFFNGTSVCLRVEGQEDEPHRLDIKALPAGWKVATAMPAVKTDAQGRGRYEAADYDELVDHPFELGPFWQGRFSAHGVQHEFVVAGALPDFDGERLLADAQRICESEIAFWHANKKPPFGRYVFMLNAVEDGYGGLEHRSSTALIAARKDLPQRGVATLSEGYVTLLGLISHEYFHTWNVKRLRPSELARIDYTQENYTELLWFFEGFTSYYDDLFLLRAGLIDEKRYFELLGKTVSTVLSWPGRQVQSLAQASFDAWVKYYRQDENTPNATISYYTKGSLAALALDLTLRSEKQGSLDDVMRALWVRSAGGPIRESDIAQALADIGGRSYAGELAQWIHGTQDLPLPALLEKLGVSWKTQTPTAAQTLGLKVSESALTGVKVSQVMRGSAAEAAGLAPGDELLAVDNWRLRRLEDTARLRPGTPGAPEPKGKGKRGAGASAAPQAWLVARDQRVLSLSVNWPEQGPASATVSLQADAQAPRGALALRQAWAKGG
jgi:predicted metalloprotease with PDZ domain